MFDETYHTTGFSRPLDPEHQCNAEDTCDHVTDLLEDHKDEKSLRELWWYFVIGPLEYVKTGRVNAEREYYLVEGSRLKLAETLSKGLVYETTWLLAHGSHHAWQINYLFEAAMFGSILDGGELAGKLDRKRRPLGASGTDIAAIKTIFATITITNGVMW